MMICDILAYKLSFVTVYCMNFVIFLCVILKLFSLRSVPLLAPNHSWTPYQVIISLSAIRLYATSLYRRRPSDEAITLLLRVPDEPERFLLGDAWRSAMHGHRGHTEISVVQPHPARFCEIDRCWRRFLIRFLNFRYQEGSPGTALGLLRTDQRRRSIVASGNVMNWELVLMLGLRRVWNYVYTRHQEVTAHIFSPVPSVSD